MKNSTFFFVLLTVLMIFASPGGLTTRVAEGLVCSTPSRSFKGLCFSTNNCANVCQNEGFPDGRCTRLSRSCQCEPELRERESMKNATVFIVLLAVLMIFASPGSLTTRVAEGLFCSTPSRTFKGWCLSSNDCANVCYIEGFPDGRCTGNTPITRYCVCRKPC